jgi:hypothetical protein
VRSLAGELQGAQESSVNLSPPRGASYLPEPASIFDYRESISQSDTSRQLAASRPLSLAGSRKVAELSLRPLHSCGSSNSPLKARKR